MRIFNLNIRHGGGSLAEEWLQRKGRAPIFFEPITLEDLRNADKKTIVEKYKRIPGKSGYTMKSQIQDAQRFVNAMENEIADTVICNLDNSKFSVCFPYGTMVEDLDASGASTTKSIAVHRTQFNLAKIPSIILTYKKNFRYSLGTFAEIDQGQHLELYLAIFSLIGEKNKLFHSYFAANSDRFNLFRSIGSNELETLVAKIFEAYGLFVPAYSGGVIQNVDIIAINDTEHEIDVSGIRIPAQNALTLQVKWQLPTGKDLSGADAYIVLESTQSSRPDIYSEAWLKNALMDKRCTKVREWFLRCIQWVPNEFRRLETIP
jgi:hypothetical protein